MCLDRCTTWCQLALFHLPLLAGYSICLQFVFKQIQMEATWNPHHRKQEQAWVSIRYLRGCAGDWWQGRSSRGTAQKTNFSFNTTGSNWYMPPISSPHTVPPSASNNTHSRISYLFCIDKILHASLMHGTLAISQKTREVIIASGLFRGFFDSTLCWCVTTAHIAMLTLHNHSSQSLAGAGPPPTISITAFANLASPHSHPFYKVPRHVFLKDNRSK